MANSSPYAFLAGCLLSVLVMAVTPTGALAQQEEDAKAAEKPAEKGKATPSPKEESAVTEHTLSGTHLGSLFGVPPTGQRVEVDTVVVWEFRGSRIKGETVYFDLATMLRQVGYLRLPAETP